MRSIMVLNAKGGCGKSTLATNLASYYADQGLPTALADFDPQGSSMDWLAERPPE
ncbi:MAG: ParA family protein, partial [Gammaproteobacteria bacterium]